MSKAPYWLQTRAPASSLELLNEDWLGLYPGEVTAIVYPDDKLSKSAKYIEYMCHVEFSYKGSRTSQQIPGCIPINVFGGLTDKFSWTSRFDSAAINPDNKEIFGKGDKVLIQFINGKQSRPVIVGGIRSDKDKDPETGKSNLGHHLDFQFNGISVNINKKGELTLTYNGPQKADGTLSTDDDSTNGLGSAKEKQVGTQIIIQNDGSAVIKTKNGQQSLKLNHDNGKIEIIADKEYNLNVTDGKTIIKSKGTELGDATDKMMLGTTYRDAENSLNNDLSLIFQQLFVNLQNAATLMKTSIAGNMVAAPFVDIAASQCQQAFIKIKAFEGKSQQYLSKKNKLD